MDTAHNTTNNAPMPVAPELSQDQIDDLEYALCVYEMTLELAAAAAPGKGQ